jgi:PhzF family phenazine biosynthesis protein
MNLYIVDAFTRQKYYGNPAAVCILDKEIDERLMQQIASEMNLSETAFLHKQGQGYGLRWFTPVDEVDLCGHATLASAHTLWQTGILKEDEAAVFYTKSGVLTAKKGGEWIDLDFPLELEEACLAPDGMLQALGVTAAYVGKNRMDYMVEVESEEIVQNLRPDFSLLATVPCRGIIVTSAAQGKNYDFVSRCFYPATGVNEDPVTGSAHCCTGPYWSKKLNKKTLVAKQLSERTGILRLQVNESRIILSGQAVTVLKGELLDHGESQ